MAKVKTEPTPTAAEAAVATFQAHTRQFIIEAEKALRRLWAVDDPALGYRMHIAPQDKFLLRACGFPVDDSHAMRRVLGRITRESRFAGEAGMADMLEKARARKVQAAQALRERGPALEAEIAKLQAELNQLRFEAESATVTVEGMESARVKLRDELPPFVREWRDERLRIARSESESYAQRMRDHVERHIDYVVELMTTGEDWPDRYVTPDDEPAEV